MSDRIKTVRGRKRASNKGHPPPSAADLFDSLMQDKPDDPKTKQAKRAPLPKATVVSEVKLSSANEGAEADISPTSAGGKAGDTSDHSRSPPVHSDDSEDEEAPVFITLSTVEGTESPEQTPNKFNSDRRPRNESTSGSIKETEEPANKELAEVQDNGKDTEHSVTEKDTNDEEVSRNDIPPPDDRGDGDSAEKSNQQKSRRSSDAGGVGSLGVSKDVEDSIRKEIENMLANNRLRNGGGGAAGDSELTEMNGHEAVDLEEDVILVEVERKKHCKFLIRRQEDQTLPTSRNYRCFRCSFNSSRMNNMVRHYKQC